MAAIHVIGGSIQDDNKTVYQYAFHVPTSADATLKTKAQADPAVSGFVSAVPDIGAGELTQIQEGDLIEELGSIRYNEGDSAAEYLARLQTTWQERALEVPSEFDRKYRWYLNTYDSGL